MNSSQFLKQSSLLMGFKQCNYGKERKFYTEDRALHSLWFHSPRHIVAFSLFLLEHISTFHYFSFFLHFSLTLNLVFFCTLFLPPCIFFAVLSDRHGVIQQVCMFPSHFPIALPHWPLSNHWPPSGWNIELGKLSAGIWQPHTPSWVQVRWNIKM